MHLPLQPAPQLCSEVSPGTVLSHEIPYPISISRGQTETYKHTTDNLWLHLTFMVIPQLLCWSSHLFNQAILHMGCY